jgi:hypothetical protein
MTEEYDEEYDEEKDTVDLRGLDEESEFETQDYESQDMTKPNTIDMATAYLIDFLSKPNEATSKVHRTYAAIAPFILQWETMQEQYMGDIIPHAKSLTKVHKMYLALTPAIQGERAEALTLIASTPRMPMYGGGQPNAVMQESGLREGHPGAEKKKSRWKFW